MWGGPGGRSRGGKRESNSKYTLKGVNTSPLGLWEKERLTSGCWPEQVEGWRSRFGGKTKSSGLDMLSRDVLDIEVKKLRKQLEIGLQFKGKIQVET